MHTTKSRAESKPSHPPIITYPEFLTNPAKRPPLITPNGFLNTLYAFSGISALIYGASNLILVPMVESLTEARHELHATTVENLDRLLKGLEAAVSEVPAAAKKQNRLPADDESVEDPSELFHRDMGIQTSLPSSPASDTCFNESASMKQAKRIEDLVARLKDVRGEDHTTQSREMAEVQAVLDVFKEEVDKLDRQGYVHSLTGAAGFGATRNEPDDEIRRAKENIRRVKGVLLSARSFPVSSR
jgi:hypothetical protein